MGGLGEEDGLLPEGAADVGLDHRKLSQEVPEVRHHGAGREGWRAGRRDRRPFVWRPPHLEVMNYTFEGAKKSPQMLPQKNNK